MRNPATRSGGIADHAVRRPHGTADTVPHVDGARLLRRIDRFSRIGGAEDGGVTRMGFSEADREARARLVSEARAAGLETSVDAGGNVFISRSTVRPKSPARPRILIGSHLDTVANGGRLDGAYGVLAGLEVLQCLAESGTVTGCDVVVVAFANEEGALFPQPFWGSMVLAGRLDALPSEPRDHAGRPLREALALAGGDLSDLASAVWAPDSVVGYLELHVEQGPVLERLGLPIGVVDSITGRTQLTVEVTGVAGHAGTSPMEGRRDPLVAAAEAVLSVERLAREDRLCRVATVGWLEVTANSPNTIPGCVRFSVDIRDSDSAGLAAAEQALRATLADLAERREVRIAIEVAVRTDRVRTDPRLRQEIAAAAADLGLACEAMPSGAGHDAQVVADIAPVGMIFVPSVDGVSHVPAERTAPEHLTAGAEVLLRTVLRL
ncbi:M20 family metallo-hydrolase [Streptomyces hainanensis]|uniref:Zn-dependent hydrolase n=1 Tax=Streptomyces hainanensis TaxID=402648 RepID=A0A4R4TNE5_9ACTN|nr:M20 family metallo-hydrolase [Streptomyces hainanensis]TDC79577.1 Zn-dependent hydrolase [Streptomyces hainanensis]